MKINPTLTLVLSLMERRLFYPSPSRGGPAWGWGIFGANKGSVAILKDGKRGAVMSEFNMLVVDDDSRYLNMIKLLFEYAGLKVFCTEKGDEALKMIKEMPFSLILTDFNMPGMNGLELARKIRKILPDTIIVMITSDPSPEITARAMRVGISRVTAKPCKMKDILDIIDEEKKELFASFRDAVSTQGKEV